MTDPGPHGVHACTVSVKVESPPEVQRRVAARVRRAMSTEASELRAIHWLGRLDRGKDEIGSLSALLAEVRREGLEEGIELGAASPCGHDPVTPSSGDLARPFHEWQESDGEVLWWRFPVVEAPYVGSPLHDDFPETVTHWTRLVVPTAPKGGVTR